MDPTSSAERFSNINHVYVSRESQEWSVLSAEEYSILEQPRYHKIEMSLPSSRYYDIQEDIRVVFFASINDYVTGTYTILF